MGAHCSQIQLNSGSSHSIDHETTRQYSHAAVLDTSAGLYMVMLNAECIYARRSLITHFLTFIIKLQITYHEVNRSYTVVGAWPWDRYVLSGPSSFVEADSIVQAKICSLETCIKGSSQSPRMSHPSTSY